MLLLNIHSYFSLRYGTIPLERRKGDEDKPGHEGLVELAHLAGEKRLVLTDINNTSASLDFVRICKRYNIQPIVGIDFRRGANCCFIGLAKNNEGFFQLNTLLSHYLHSNKETDFRAPELSHCHIIYPFSSEELRTSASEESPPNSKLAVPLDAQNKLPEPEELRDNEWIGVRLHELKKLRFSKWKNHLHKLVLLHSFSFRHKSDFNLHRLLRSVDLNILLSKLPVKEQGRETDLWMSDAELITQCEEFPELIENTEKILSSCSFHFDFGPDFPKNKKTYTGDEAADFELLRKLCTDGLSYRYPEVNEQIHSRLEKELDIIRQKNFVTYFLINWDILKYARSKGYFYVGRGSGANSIVAYLLRITDVDPIELDLYFERFINLFRKNPPDFDLDFSWTDRDDIQNYIFENFPNTALLAVYNTFQLKAAIRELGKVFGLPIHEIEELNEGNKTNHITHDLARLIVLYASRMVDMPNILSIHAGGILISEKPLQHYCATFLPPKGMTTVQFDMVIAEDAGLYKFDILSQRGLGKIKDSLTLIDQNQPDHEPFDIHDLTRFKQDPDIQKMMREAKAIGCFYVESPAMRMLLTKLRCETYLGLVAASSIIRPGVASSGMMREYILRERMPERRKEAHPILLDLMPETYGIMVYQEDVIKVAHHFGGLTLGEADMLRRGMSGKYRGREEFAVVQKQFMDNCYRKGYPEKTARDVWDQIASFAGYAFSKGHSASYAVESYQCLFLKAHYPLEYLVATINNGGGFYNTELYVHEARVYGGKIEPPCVNHSNAESIIEGTTIWLGFQLLMSINEETIRRIVSEREHNGLFKDFEDFCKRVPISVEQAAILVRINAFRFTGKNKYELLWEAHLKVHTRIPATATLFDTPSKRFQYPELTAECRSDAYDEIELLGYPLTSPFNLLKDPDEGVTASEFPKLVGRIVTAIGYMVIVKEIYTRNGKRMKFGTFLDRNGEYLDTVHFPEASEKYPFRGKGFYRMKGKVAEEFDAYSLEVESVEHVAYNYVE